MPAKKPKVQAKPAKKNPAAKGDKAFAAALVNLENTAKERIATARDPLKTGIRIANQIRAVAERVEDEVRAESIAMTEASYASDGAVGMMIGVL